MGSKMMKVCYARLLRTVIAHQLVTLDMFSLLMLLLI